MAQRMFKDAFYDCVHSGDEYVRSCALAEVVRVVKEACAEKASSYLDALGGISGVADELGAEIANLWIEPDRTV